MEGFTYLKMVIGREAFSVHVSTNENAILATTYSSRYECIKIDKQRYELTLMQLLITSLENISVCLIIN